MWPSSPNLRSDLACTQFGSCLHCEGLTERIDDFCLPLKSLYSLWPALFFPFAPSLSPWLTLKAPSRLCNLHGLQMHCTLIFISMQSRSSRISACLILAWAPPFSLVTHPQEHLCGTLWFGNIQRFNLLYLDLPCQVPLSQYPLDKIADASAPLLNTMFLLIHFGYKWGRQI